MRASLALFLLVAATAVSTGAWASIMTDNPEESLTLPSFTHQVPSKNSWPELVGKVASEAKAILEGELPADSRVHLIPQGSMVTMDYRTDRVRVYYDPETNLVVTPPRVG